MQAAQQPVAIVMFGPHVEGSLRALLKPSATDNLHPGLPKSTSPEARERAVRMVWDGVGRHDSHWAANVSISSKIGCAPLTLNEWVKKVEVDTGQRGGITTEQA